MTFLVRIRTSWVGRQTTITGWIKCVVWRPPPRLIFLARNLLHSSLYKGHVFKWTFYWITSLKSWFFLEELFYGIQMLRPSLTSRIRQTSVVSWAVRGSGFYIQLNWFDFLFVLTCYFDLALSLIDLFIFGTILILFTSCNQLQAIFHFNIIFISWNTLRNLLYNQDNCISAWIGNGSLHYGRLGHWYCRSLKIIDGNSFTGRSLAC